MFKQDRIHCAIIFPKRTIPKMFFDSKQRMLFLIFLYMKSVDLTDNSKGERRRSHGLHLITVEVQIDSECNWGCGAILLEMK